MGEGMHVGLDVWRKRRVEKKTRGGKNAWVMDAWGEYFFYASIHLVSINITASHLQELIKSKKDMNQKSFTPVLFYSKSYSDSTTAQTKISTFGRLFIGRSDHYYRHHRQEFNASSRASPELIVLLS